MCDISCLPKICHWWKIFLSQAATLRGIPAQGETAAIQPGSLRGRGQGKPTQTVLFMVHSGWFVVKLCTTEKTCIRLLVLTTFFAPWYMGLRKAIHYSCVHHRIGASSSYASMLTVSFCNFVGFHRTD